MNVWKIFDNGECMNENECMKKLIYGEMNDEMNNVRRNKQVENECMKNIWMYEDCMNENDYEKMNAWRNEWWNENCVWNKYGKNECMKNVWMYEDCMNVWRNEWWNE